MKVTIFTFADSVELYEGSRLVIAGTFDGLRSAEFPFVQRPFALAVKLTADRSDYGKKYHGRFTLRRKGHKTSTVKVPVEVTFQSPPKGQNAYHMVVVNIFNAKFETPGVYVAKLTVNSKQIFSTNLHILRVRPAVQTPRTKTRKSRKPPLKKKA